MPDTTDATQPPKLTEAERADLLEGVEGVILCEISESAIPIPDRDDAAQECRLAVWQASSRFDPRKAKFSTFATAVVRTVLTRLLSERAAKAPPGGMYPLAFGEDEGYAAAEVPDPRPAGPDAPPPPDAVDEGLADLHRTAARHGYASLLDSVRPGERELLVLVAIDRMTAEQAALRMGRPVKWVKMTLTGIVRTLAAAGHVPAGLAGAVGLDAAELARQGDPVTARKERDARRALVAEAGGDADPAELAGLLGVSREAVQRDRKALGLKRTPPATVVRLRTQTAAEEGAARAERNRRIVAAVAAGRTQEAVAIEFGVSQSTVFRVVAEADGRRRRSRAVRVA